MLFKPPKIISILFLVITFIFGARWHESNAVAPSAVLQVPAGQGLQEPISPSPVELLQVPEGHSMHASVETAVAKG